MHDSAAVNRSFYDPLWSDTRLVAPERFNTWQLVSGLLPSAAVRLEIGPGLRPRLPLAGTSFVDISPPAIEKLAAQGGSAVLGNGTELPFGSATFELVCAFDVIEHTRDDRRVFSEVSRVLKPDGVFVFSVPLYAGLWTRFDEFVGHVRRYEPADLQRLLSDHDLLLESSAAYGMQPSQPWLLNVGLWYLTHRRSEALWWYNRMLLPLGMLFQKRLQFVAGMISARGVDEIVLVCRKQVA